MTVTRVLVTYVKDPAAVLDFGFDWSLWLATGETITTSTWTLPPDLTSPAVGLTENSHSHNTTASTIWLLAGVDGEDYIITNHIHTSAGRDDDRSLKIKVRNR
jgi:hypothetical protein